MSSLDCEFKCGPEEFHTLEESEIVGMPSPDGDIFTRVRICQTSGVHIVSGEADQLDGCIEFVYYSVDFGVICFEQYSCELTFILPTVRFGPEIEFSLRNVHESKKPIIEE